MNRIFLSLGSNQGDRAAYLRQVRSAIEDHNCSVLAASSIYETSPVKMDNCTPFFNQILEITTELKPQELIKRFLEIEKDFGRLRNGECSSRTIDIDIIFYGAEVIKDENLKIPHPRMCERLFVLEPLSELAPDFMHPVRNKTVRDLLLECREHFSDTQTVRYLSTEL